MESPASLAAVIRDGTHEERDHYGHHFLRFMFEAPSRTGLLHADPHPGNFRLLPREDGSPGRLGVLDYGAVARLPERSLPRAIGALIRIALLEDYDQLVTALRDEGFIRERITIDPEMLRAYLGPFLEPAAAEEFTFSRSWMQEQFRRVNDPRGDAYAAMLRLNMPPAYMLMHRTFTGGIGVLSQLGRDGPVPPGADRLAAGLRRLSGLTTTRSRACSPSPAGGCGSSPRRTTVAGRSRRPRSR